MNEDVENFQKRYNTSQKFRLKNFLNESKFVAKESLKQTPPVPVKSIKIDVKPARADQG